MIRPFSSQGDNLVNILNETIIVFSFISVYVMNNSSLSELAMKVWGWFLIVPIIISLVTTWIISLPEAIEEFTKTFADLFKKKEKQTKARSLSVQAKPKDGNLRVD